MVAAKVLGASRPGRLVPPIKPATCFSTVRGETYGCAAMALPPIVLAGNGNTSNFRTVTPRTLRGRGAGAGSAQPSELVHAGKLLRWRCEVVDRRSTNVSDDGFVGVHGSRSWESAVRRVAVGIWVGTLSVFA